MIVVKCVVIFSSLCSLLLWFLCVFHSLRFTLQLVHPPVCHYLLAVCDVYRHHCQTQNQSKRNTLLSGSYSILVKMFNFTLLVFYRWRVGRVRMTLTWNARRLSWMARSSHSSGIQPSTLLSAYSLSSIGESFCNITWHCVVQPQGHILCFAVCKESTSVPRTSHSWCSTSYMCSLPLYKVW